MTKVWFWHLVILEPPCDFFEEEFGKKAILAGNTGYQLTPCLPGGS